MVKLEGVIIDIVYRNDENGYSVIELDVEGELETAVGSCPHVHSGEYAVLYGSWTEHKSYGRQFKIASIETTLPQNTISIEMYLASGIIRGIGPATANRIVSNFGLQTFEIIEHEYERLADIKGISKNLAQSIHENYMNNAALKSVIMGLQALGLSVKQSLRVYERYGAAAKDLIEQNPYRMIDDIHGVGFERADRIAQTMGIDRNSDFRVQNGIKHVLKLALAEGHTCLPENVLISKTAEIIGVESANVVGNLNQLAIEGDIAKKLYSGVTAIFLMSSYIAETDCARRIYMLKNAKSKIPIDNIMKKIDLYADTFKISDEQRKAVYDAIVNNVCIITGGPGTGKTTITKVLLKILEANGIMTVLAAPTGRAAKRMEESCGKEAKTIHRLLEFGFDFENGDDSNNGSKNKFMRNEDNPLNVDAIIVDEASMVDVFLANSLLRALKEDTKLIFVGDVDQLPSVGAGNFLRDLIKSEYIPIFRLTKFYRQSEGGNIIPNAHLINNGQLPNMHQTGDFIFIPKNDPNQALDAVVNLVCQQEYENAQVLCPLKKGVIGVYNLNLSIREKLNPMRPSSPQLKKGETIYRKGDKVIQIKNNYNKEWIYTSTENYYQQGFGVYNGDIGYIADIDVRGKTAIVVFDDRQAEYTINELEQLEHAYSITIHKSQGSEFDTVIIPLVYGNSPFLTKNLLYTAVTRAKKKVIIVGQNKTIQHMVTNNRITRRYTVLNNEIRELVEIFDQL